VNFEKIPGIWLSLSGVVYALGLMGCLLMAPTSFTVGFGLGGLLVLLNALGSARRLKRAEFPHKNRVMASLLGGFYVRLILMGLCLFGFIKYLRVDPFGLVTGLTVVPAGLVVMLALIYFANRRPEEA
jgi:hypothetical protein